MDRRSFLRNTAGAAAGAALSRELLKPLASAEVAAQAAPPKAAPSAASGDLLFRDDFSSLPAGWLSEPIKQLNGAIQEYHYFAHRGTPLGAWDNAIVHMDAWIAGDENGKSYVEQHLVNELAYITNPILITGDPEWADTTVAVKLRPLSFADMAGVVFRYRTNRHYYLFALTGGKTARLVVRLPVETKFKTAEWREIARKDFAYDTTRYYALKVENSGLRIVASIDGDTIFDVRDEELLKGKAGITANIPARFQEFVVTAPAAARAASARRIASREAEVRKLRAENPQPKLWRKFSTPNFGAGRAVRFGDLDGDGRLEMLIAQNVPRVASDAFDAISCLTAVTLDGRVLWQSGRAKSGNGLLTNDVPAQIHDIDGDGRNEVVCVRDFQVQVLDGSTGKLKHAAPTPAAIVAAGQRRPYELENGDALAFVNVSGDRARRDVLIKDRYRNFWVLNKNLELLWKGHGQTGHFPYPFDVDGDGRDEILMGYALWDHDGKQLWSRDDEIKDHADAVAIGNYSGDPKGEIRAYAACSDEGVIVFSRAGEILKHVRLGHGQNMSIARYRPEMPGLQVMVINFWRNPGIVTLLDFDGNVLEQAELLHCGSPLLPVNWRGDGQEFALLNGNPREGGMIDGHLRRVVMFPDDGHPDTCCAVADLTGDGFDDVILWDPERVHIYTADRATAGKRVYAPVRNPLYNESNYRALVSMPGWKT